MSYTNGLDNPELYFQTKLYSGTGSTNSVTFDGSENMQPDWVWIKARSNSDQPHALFDSVRGVNKVLYSNNTDAEDDDSSNGSLTSFNSDGFTVGGYYNRVNQSGQTFASWNWKAGGSASSNSDGSITSSVSANTTAGFSIVSYTGTGSNATIGHGLGSTPAMIIWKNRSQSNGWIVYHHKNTSAPETDYLELHSTNATNDLNTIMNDTAPTSSVFTVGTEGAVNNSGNNFIAYCFAEKKGYSKFGSYTGNGNADGTFVYTGFKPAWVMIKCSSSSGSYPSWSIFDTTRQTFNVNAGKTLYANKSSAEGVRGNGSDSSTTIPAIDMLSNGFKSRVLNDEVNNTETYIYMCFAESPFVTGASAIPTTAR